LEHNSRGHLDTGGADTIEDSELVAVWHHGGDFRFRLMGLVCCVTNSPIDYQLSVGVLLWVPPWVLLVVMKTGLKTRPVRRLPCTPELSDS